MEQQQQPTAPAIEAWRRTNRIQNGEMLQPVVAPTGEMAIFRVAVRDGVVVGPTQLGPLIAASSREALDSLLTEMQLALRTRPAVEHEKFETLVSSLTSVMVGGDLKPALSGDQLLDQLLDNKVPFQKTREQELREMEGQAVDLEATLGTMTPIPPEGNLQEALANPGTIEGEDKPELEQVSPDAPAETAEAATSSASAKIPKARQKKAE